MANKIMIVESSYSQSNCYKSTLVTSRGLEFASQLWLLSLYLGAGKHPSPLEKPKTISPNDYLTVGFYRIKKYCSDQKLLRFKDCSTRTSVTSCQPLYIDTLKGYI